MLAEILHRIAGMERKEQKYRIRPSMASPEILELDHKGRCKRQMVYGALDFPSTNMSDRFIMTMDDSSWHEELTADWVRKTTFSLRDSQMEIDCGYFGKGKIDGILTDMLGKDYLYEHKALNHFSFNKFDSDKELPIDYIVQCCVYLNQELATYDINQALLLVKNKNTAQYLEFLIEYDKEKDIVIILYRQDSIDQKKIDLNIEIADILKRTREKFEFVETCKNEKRLPKRDYDISDWQCSYCNFKGACWQDYEQEFKELKGDIELSNDIEERLAYYLELGLHLKNQKKEQDEIKDQIKAIMQEKDAKMATTERYAIVRSLIKSKRIDQDLIPPELLAGFQTESLSERLSIRLRKEVK
ncbi:MAG: hypothetical protein WC623_24225 [Pedobacter sp.]|uniref:hypothetical protein n=1 Tax=Pedobacter sp. TaxID=1411316 RepID=UPI003561D412